MLLRVNDNIVINYSIKKYIYNKKTYYTYIYNNNNKLKTGDYITFKCTCGKIVTRKFYPRNDNNNYLICSKCKLKQKYGVENISQLDEIKRKKKETMIKNYGVENISQLDEIKRKKKETMIKNYGTDNPLSLEKTKETIKEKYDVENPAQSEEVKEKIKQTNLKKYGKTSILADKEKMKKACQIKYGNENYNNREKAKQTNLEKYGQENPWGFGSKNYREYILTKSYEKYLMSENVIPLFSLEEYLKKENKYNKFEWQCKKCGNRFKGYYENGIIPRCFSCYPKIKGFSGQEKEIVEYCKSLELNIIENDRDIIPPYEVDIYLPDYNLAIEYNGLYWHSIIYKKDKYYHQNKVKLAHEKGIRLLHIWEHEWYEDKESIQQIIQYYIEHLQEEIVPEEPKLYNIYDNLIWI